MKTLVERLRDQADRLKNGKSVVHTEILLREAIAALEAATALTSPGTGGVLADSVAEVMDECGGAWRPCTGCYETSDGYNINGHPYSKTFKCIVGSGCHECGGIGAIWDNADYSTIGPAEYADERKETGGGAAAEPYTYLHESPIFDTVLSPDREYAAEHAARPERWKVTPLYRGEPLPAAPAPEGA